MHKVDAPPHLKYALAWAESATQWDSRQVHGICEEGLNSSFIVLFFGQGGCQ
jgi:hypothetical protein